MIKALILVYQKIFDNDNANRIDRLGHLIQPLGIDEVGH